MSALDTFGNTGTSACERQCTDTIRPDDHVRICLGEASLRRENVSRALFGVTTHDFAVPKEFQSRNFDPDFQFGIDELPNAGAEFSGSLEDDECSGLRDFEISSLPGRRIGGIYVTTCQRSIPVHDQPLNCYRLLRT